VREARGEHAGGGGALRLLQGATVFAELVSQRERADEEAEGDQRDDRESERQQERRDHRNNIAAQGSEAAGQSRLESGARPCK
jgi:hypothetical protein